MLNLSDRWVGDSCRGWSNRQLFGVFQMMLDGRKRLFRKLLHVGIIAFRWSGDEGFVAEHQVSITVT